MAIYHLHDIEKEKKMIEEEMVYTEVFETQHHAPQRQPQESKKDRLFSSLVTRCCFLLLLFADCLWGIYAFLLLIGSSLGILTTFSKVALFKKAFAKACLSCKRSLICGVSLFVGLFSPAFGIMVGCTYFLMYDKEGIDEVVPTSLRGQFKELFKG